MSNQAFPPPTSTNSMDADLQQSHQQNEYGNRQWGDVGGYNTGWVQYNATPMHEYQGLDFEKLAYIASGPSSPISAHLNIDDGHASHDN
jgi:hypothetical protein